MGKIQIDGGYNTFLANFRESGEYKVKRNKEVRVLRKSEKMTSGFLIRHDSAQILKQNVSKSVQTQNFFEENFTIQDPFLKSWSSKQVSYCDGKFKGYANLFVRWENITLDPTKSTGAYGGEEIVDVLKQRESNELLNPKFGVFEASCRRRPKYDFARYFNNRGHLPTWLKMVKMTVPRKSESRKQNVIQNFTIAIQRYEYANMYHSMNDIFNVFLLHIFFHQDPSNTTLIFADGHPKGHIDPLWEKLFGQIIRVRHLKTKTTFREMIWAMLEKFCPLNLFDLKQVGYIDHFRSFVLGKYGINVRKSPDCEKPNVLFLWRRDYLSHPRNPKQKIMRKISNEEELFNTTKKAFPDLNFRSVDLATKTMEDQLKIISETDIIIAMHGAGLTLEMFLPPNGAVLELLPYDPKMSSKKQYDLFKVIAERIPLHHKHWQNKDKKNEISVGNTYIPPQIVQSLLKDLLHKVCPGK